MAMPRKWPRGYYTYLIIYPDGTPVYVGAGKEARCNPKNKIIGGEILQNRALAEHGRGLLVIVYEKDSKKEAFAHEEELILHYGRRDIGTGTLYNRTDGLGAKGIVPTLERSQKLSAALRGRKFSEERKVQMRAAMLGNRHLLGHIHTEETRKKISLAGKGRKLDLSDEERRQRSLRATERNLARKGKKLNLSPEQRQKRSDNAKRIGLGGALSKTKQE